MTNEEPKTSTSPEQENEKPRLSPSKVTSYQTCGYKFFRTYIQGEWKPPGIAAVRGSGVHGAAQANFAQKIESHEDLPKSDLVDIAVASFEQKMATDGVLLTHEEESTGRPKVIGQAKDQTVVLAGLFAEQQAPDYQPEIVEEYVKIPIAGSSHDLSGRIDLLTNDWRVRDFKTASKSKRQADVDTSFQLQYYALAAYVRTGRKVRDVGLDVSVITKTGKTSRQVLTTTPTATDFRAMVARMNAVIDAINKGSFPPAPAGHWMCSARWCGFAADNDCPYYNAERDPTNKLYQIGGSDAGD